MDKKVDSTECFQFEDDIYGQLACVESAMGSSFKLQADTAKVIFLIFCASLVFIMQAGFAMVCAGCVRKKNVQNTMLKNLLDVCGSSIAFYFVGYAFAFGGDPEKKSFIGNSKFFMLGMADENGIEYAHWLFQFTFAATSATIVAGTVAERCQMNAYLLYSMMLTGFVYPVVVHNIWSPSGILSSSSPDPYLGVGMIDFAGSGVVHVTGGITALVSTLLLGPRKGRFHDDKGNKLQEPKTFPGHSKSLQMLGAFLLWFGWFGFNAGSAIDVDSDLSLPVIAAAVTNSTLAGSAAAITSLFLNLIIQERLTGEPKYRLSSAMNGALTGLASITGCCGLVKPWAALVIGFFAGIIYHISSNFLESRCIDDAVDAIPVHLSGGIWGVIATGLFASPRELQFWYGIDTDVDHVGWFYSWGRGSGDARLLACQVVGLLFIIGWTVGIMLPFFVVLNYLGAFRADSLEELVGLDISYHGYNPGGVPREQLEEYYSRRPNLRRRADFKPIEENTEDDQDGVDLIE